MEAPEAVERAHEDYLRAGAELLTTNTFRTQPGLFPETWRTLVATAVRSCRNAAERTGKPCRVAGSIAPLADCYRPDSSPARADPGGTRARHAELAQALAPDVDLLLCETFPNPLEARLAVEAAVATGRETWIALTPGPAADLLTPAQLARAARDCIAAGAAAALVNCAPAARTADFLAALGEACGADVPIGAYANAGSTDDGIGWNAGPPGPQRYAELARGWLAQGATLLGSCCGTGPEHIAALAALLRDGAPRSPQSGS